MTMPVPDPNVVANLYLAGRASLDEALTKAGADKTPTRLVLWLASAPDGEVRAILPPDGHPAWDQLNVLSDTVALLKIAKETGRTVVQEAIEGLPHSKIHSPSVPAFLADWRGGNPCWQQVEANPDDWTVATAPGGDAATAKQFPLQRWEVTRVGSNRPWLGWMVAPAGEDAAAPGAPVPLWLRSSAHLLAGAGHAVHTNAAALLKALNADPYPELVGNSSAIPGLLDAIDTAAPTESYVLITGESGVGKELVARAFHDKSTRSRENFIIANCATLAQTSDLASSALFGHVKGAFTGAHTTTEGYVSQAKNGTLFLDEITELPLAAQSGLLGLLADRNFTKVGSRDVIQANVRIVCATNRDLEAMVARREFRDDLYHRISVVRVRVPPLRDRRDDAVHLVLHFLRKHNATTRRNVWLTNDAIDYLCGLDLPGNIRQLSNLVEMLVARGGGVDIILSRDRVRLLCAESGAPEPSGDIGRPTGPTSPQQGPIDASRPRTTQVGDDLGPTREQAASPSRAALFATLSELAHGKSSDLEAIGTSIAPLLVKGGYRLLNADVKQYIATCVANCRSDDKSWRAIANALGVTEGPCKGYMTWTPRNTGALPDNNPEALRRESPVAQPQRIPVRDPPAPKASV